MNVYNSFYIIAKNWKQRTCLSHLEELYNFQGCTLISSPAKVPNQVYLISRFTF